MTKLGPAAVAALMGVIAGTGGGPGNDRQGPPVWLGGKRGTRIDAARRIDEKDGADGYYRRPGESFLRSRFREQKKAKRAEKRAKRRKQ